MTKEQQATKKQIIDYLLRTKREAYDRLFKAQQSDLSMAGQTQENEDDLFGGGKVDQSIGRVEAKAKVLEDLSAQIDLLDDIGSVKANEEIQLGDVIETDRGHFFVAVPATAFEIEGKEYRGISADSPLFEALKGCHDGDTVKVNNIEYRLISSY